ncbi:hypothetical protein FHS85_000296 [Rhodoligotrophos appendicifer]|uniref:DUF992 domain-containing protein n=1 Tax=Rhodoligotrophos appendicifer TaxID=987056 RepID=UPI00117D6124|nr:DUF992 domain-containing protein [Rhodoligotrophos appendicifer]
MGVFWKVALPLCTVLSFVSVANMPVAQSAPAAKAVGLLNCKVMGPDVALHFGSSRQIRCVYVPDGRGRRQTYDGMLRKYGIEVGVIGDTSISWTVMAHRNRISRGALSGSYRGFTVEATIGVGSGANIFMREGDQSVSLLPLAMQEQVGGFNAAVGAATMDLALVR